MSPFFETEIRPSGSSYTSKDIRELKPGDNVSLWDKGGLKVNAIILDDSRAEVDARRAETVMSGELDPDGFTIGGLKDLTPQHTKTVVKEKSIVVLARGPWSRQRRIVWRSDRK